MQLRNNTVKICELLGEHGLNDKYFMPNIQRPFVWLDKPSDKQIENLFDSLLKNYPIGTFLIWEMDESEVPDDIILERFQRDYDTANTQNETCKKDKIGNYPISLILDGQQRLTALYIGFEGSYTKTSETTGNKTVKELYVNLDKEPQENNPEDKYEFEFLTDAEFKQKDDKGEHWFKCKDIKKYDSLQIKKFDNTAYKILTSLYDLYHNYNGREIPVQILKQASSEDAVEVFTRVNSKGRSLDKSDILMSFIIAKFKNEDIKKSIYKKVEDWQENFPSFSVDKFLNICMLLTSEHAEARYRVDDFTTKRIALIENKWTKIIKSVDKAIDKLIAFGYQKQEIYTNIIACLAFYYYKNKKHPKDSNAILNFIQRMQLSGFFGRSTNSQLTKIAQIINNVNSFSEVLENLSEDLTISDDKIQSVVKEAKYGQASALAVLQLIFDNLNYEHTKFHIDHIYPRNGKDNMSLKRKNHLFNLEIIDLSQNEDKKDKNPQEWLDNTYGKCSELQKQFKKEHYLPLDMELTWDNIENFEEARKQILIEKLRDKFN